MTMRGAIPQRESGNVAGSDLGGSPAGHQWRVLDAGRGQRHAAHTAECWRARQGDSWGQLARSGLKFKLFRQQCELGPNVLHYSIHQSHHGDWVSAIIHELQSRHLYTGNG